MYGKWNWQTTLASGKLKIKNDNPTALQNGFGKWNWKMENGNRQMKNGKRQIAMGKWQTAKIKWQIDSKNAQRQTNNLCNLAKQSVKDEQR